MINSGMPSINGRGFSLITTVASSLRATRATEAAGRAKDPETLCSAWADHVTTFDIHCFSADDFQIKLAAKWAWDPGRYA